MKQKHEQELAMNIDYDLFTTEEIVKIFNFYSLMERTKNQKVNKETILESYYEYKNIINNLSLEKKYDQNFFKITGISIYQTIKKLEGKN